MKLTQLNAFKAIIECQTVTAAAERLHLSQPAVSRLLSSLEQRLGFKLFIRKGNRLELSDEGQAFYLEVAKVFDAVAGLDQAANSIRSNHFGSLNIAAMPLLSNAFLPRVVATFLSQTPKLKLGFKTYRSEDVIRRIQSQTADIGFAFVDDIVAGAKAQRVECECVCLVPASSPLAKRKVIDIYDIADQVLIRHEKDATQRRIDALLRRYSLSTIEHIEVSLASTAAALVKEGVGIAITDPFTAVIDSEHPNVVMRPLVFGLPFEFDILYPALKPIHRHAEHFIEQFMLLADALDVQLKIGPMRDLDE
ncbi:LysR family transcriptional regulator [Photobacterium gaetbulicola]|uniref:LysR family transcriptional regulator n=1 Tax=Photobacterium gaetbulicola TaxID=1295392 RepID=A0A0B9H2Z7_9GAMM|nr:MULTISPECIES: LysR family transcriptional regulator [Photobacterium]KHT63237.1 LysR family transcriptional regulator [Photobacterium gaetbulicola]WEM43636.1 LysR family transcriptional regulator [Photobacterium sp. DA100]